MMHIQWPLFCWLFRPLVWLTLVSSMAATCYVLCQDQPLSFRFNTEVFVFILMHSFLISRLVGRVRSESFAYLYSQGFSRDLLWGHVWLATLASVTATWLPSVLLIQTPLRGMYQDYQLNPWFPLMASTEWPFLIWLFLVYGLALPLFHYEWIRSAMPYQGLLSGHLLAICYLITALSVEERLMLAPGNRPQWWLLGGFAVVSLIIGLFGRWAHRRMEVVS